MCRSHIDHHCFISNIPQNIPCSAFSLPPTREKPRSSCPSSERWKAAMSAEGRPVKRWSLTGGKESETSANRRFLSCHRDLELDWALSLYAALFHCMANLAFKYHSAQSQGNLNNTLVGLYVVEYSAVSWHLWTISSLILNCDINEM